MFELLEEREIGLGGNKVIDHIDRSGAKDALVLQTGLIGNGFSQSSFSCTGVADEDDVFLLLDEITLQ